MKITPITYQNHSKFVNKNTSTNSVKSEPVFFAGNKIIGGLKKVNGGKTFFKSLITSFCGLFTISKTIEAEKFDEKECQALYSDLKTQTIDMETFKKFYISSPQLAKALVKSGRTVGLYDISLLSDIDTNDFTNSKYLALECVLGTYNKSQRPVFNTFDITTKYVDSLDDTVINSVIKHRDELDVIFSNSYQTLNGGQDYLDAAIVLDRSSDITVDELQAYFSNMSEYNLNSMLMWVKSDVNIRNKVLEQIEQNNDISDYLEKYEKPIIPTQNLLDKFALISKYKKLGKGLETYIKNPSDIFDEIYTVEKLEQGIDNLELLSGNTLENAKKTTLSNIIVHFDVYKKDRTLTNDATLDDFIWLAEMSTKYLSERQIHFLFDSEAIYDLQHIGNKDEKLFQQNSEIIKLVKINNLTSIKTILEILFSSEMLDRVMNLGEILDEDLDNIIKELTYKCKNKNPVFPSVAKKFLIDKDSIVDIVSNPGLDKSEMIENLFQISKIRSLIAENPEKYINDKNYDFSDLEMCFLAKYLQLGNYDEKSAEEYLENLDNFLQQKIVLACMKINFYKNGLNYLYGAMTTTDSEYVNILLSKRFDKFWQNIYEIYNLPFKTKMLISNLIHHAKNKNKNGEVIKLSGKQKDTIVKYVPIVQKIMKKDMESLIEKYSSKVGNKGDFIFDLEGFLEDYNKFVFKKLGYDKDAQKLYEASLFKWDKNYVHLLLKPNIMDKGELKLVFDLITRGEFNSYISNPMTAHGQSNLTTKKIYKKLGLDYKRWIEGIPNEEIEISGKKYTIGLLDKGAPNNLFMGTYTSCCTALNGDKGDSVPNYLLNTAFNVVGITDEQGNLVATSRIFISSETKGNTALIIDNIEVSNRLRTVLDDETSNYFVEELWNYMKRYSEFVSKRKMPVYMSKKYQKIKLPDRPEIISSVRLAGAVTKSQIYINTIGERVNPKESYSCELIDVFNKN